MVAPFKNPTTLYRPNTSVGSDYREIGVKEEEAQFIVYLYSGKITQREPRFGKETTGEPARHVLPSKDEAE